MRLYISILEASKLLGMSHKTATKWLELHDALITIGAGKKRFTTLALLKERFPDIFDELLQ